MRSCDLRTQLLFTGDQSSLCVQSWETRAIYSLRRLLSIDRINATDYFKFLSYGVQKYEFPTISLAGSQTTKQANPSYFAGWPSRLTTMSMVCGQINTTQPNYVGGLSLSQLTIVCGHIQAEGSCSTECSSSVIN